MSRLPEDVTTILKKGLKDGFDKGYLNLMFRKINDDMILELCEWLVKLEGRVNSLNVGDNEITSPGLSILFATLTALNSCIKTISLNENPQLNDECMNALGEYIKSNKNIEVIGLALCKISDVGIEILAPYLDGNSTLKQLDLGLNERITDKSVPILLKMIKTSHVEVIEVKLTSITKEGLLLLPLVSNVIKYRSPKLHLIKSGSNIQKYDKCRGLTDDHLTKICNLMKEHGVSSLVEINLYNNNLTFKGAKLLLETLKEYNSVVTELNLAKNYIDDGCFKELSNFVQGNRHLKRLNFDNNKINDTLIEILAEALFENTWIRELSFVGNQEITDVSVPILVELAKNSWIVDINVSKTSISKERIEEIIDAIELPIEQRSVSATPVLKPNQSIIDGVQKMFEAVTGYFWNKFSNSKHASPIHAEIYGIALKIEKCKQESKLLLFHTSRITIEKFKLLLNYSLQQLPRLEILETELNRDLKPTKKEEIEYYLMKGEERDKIRDKLLDDFSYLKDSLRQWSQITLGVFKEEWWNSLLKLKDRIIRLESYVKIREGSLNAIDQQTLSFLTELAVESINTKQSILEEAEFMEKELNQYVSKIESHKIQHDKRKQIEQLEITINDKENEIDNLEIQMLKQTLEISANRKSLSQQEKEKLEQEIKDAEGKIKSLYLDYGDMIEELLSKCKDENGLCIFCDLVLKYSSQLNVSGLTSSISTSKELIKIPFILKVKSSRCEILERIDDGAFSSVYKAIMKKRGRDDIKSTAAFKQFRISTQKISESDIQMIEREIEMLSPLNHDNIVKIIGAIGDPNARDINDKLLGIGIVMEYCENGSLRSLLNKNADNNQQQLLNMDLIIHLLFGAAQGLEYLHNHTPHAIIHGDIKSDNILIDKEYNAKLCDFGISKLQQTTMASTKGGNVVGTLAYKAPETFGGKMECGSDVYSFGCVILEMLTGERPWNELGNDVAAIVTKVLVIKEQHDLSKVRTDVKEELIDLMKRCLDYDKEKRPSMKQVRMELEMMMNSAALIELDNKSDEYNKLKNLFFPGEDKEGSLNRKDYRIVKIDKIRHPFAERRYDAELSNIKSMLNGDDANERLLFHGTSETDPMKVLNHPDAFMKDYSSQGLYGRGLYFAELARYVNTKYRYNIPNTGQNQMLVCSVICGKSLELGTEVNEITRELSQKHLEKEYHSIHAGLHRASFAGPGVDDSCMFVVYKDTQVLPKYLITYEESIKQG